MNHITSNKFFRILLLTLGVSAVSCDFLDKMPDDQKTMDMVWKSQKETEKFLYNIYASLPDPNSMMWSTIPWVPVSDELDIVWDRYYPTSINVGNWNPTTNYYDIWSACYKSIRASFVFENNIDRCFELSDNLKTQYRAEAKFLRGYYYWLLLRQYGPFVLVENELDWTDDLNLPRTPYDECVAYICRMMDEAMPDLPLSWRSSNPTWLGKPDQMACLAVKSQVLLMAASPQWNGNADYVDFVNKDGTPLVNTAYSEQKWRDAAEAAHAVIEAAEGTSGEYAIRLYRNDENNDGAFNPFRSVQDVHLVKWNCECLWGTTKGDFRNVERHATPRPGGYSGLAPTQRMVDAFFMMNGRTIDDASSGYVEEGFAVSAHPNWTNDDVSEIRKRNCWGHRAGERNMYANREARFYAAILYNGRPVPQVAPEDRDLFSSSINRDGWGRAEFYSDGMSGSGSADHSTTGYTILKYVNYDSNPYRGQQSAWRNGIYIRLAEIYLNYIEALNEYDPSNPDIKKYWDLIRSRAGLPSIFDTYPEIKGNTAKQLEYIIRERQVELCFEGDRYFTTRRRLLSDKVDTGHAVDHRMYGDNGPLYGMNIAAGGGFTAEDFYKRTVIENRVFEKKMYLWPIPQHEMDRDTQLVQNPGW